MDKNSSKKKKLCNNNKHPNMLQTTNITEEQLNPVNKKEAEERIHNFIILKAWRNQREKNKQLEVNVKNMSKKVESLQLQIYALRQLLEAEKTRVVHVNYDLKKVTNALEECKLEKWSLTKEKEQLENRLSVMEDKVLEMENECKNQKNELFTVKLEAQNWEKQLEKEREKLLKIKENRKIEEVRLKGNLLVWQIRSSEQLSRLCNILQSKSNNPALPWDETFGRIDPEPEISRIQEKNVKKQQAIVIVEKLPEILELKALLAKMEKKVVDEDVRTEELEKSILGKTGGSSVIFTELHIFVKVFT